MTKQDFLEWREVVGGANGVTKVLTRDFLHPRRALMQRATGGKLVEAWVGGFW